jgi:hypothetical protein
MAGGAETPNIAALPAIARLGACESARGPDADRYVKLLIQFAVKGSLSGAYSHSGFFIEYGWGGRVIDPATWQPHETFDGPSLWGHERLHMPEEQRERMREMRLSAAARGVRMPDPSVPPLNCPWLDEVIARE